MEEGRMHGQTGRNNMFLQRGSRAFHCECNIRGQRSIFLRGIYIPVHSRQRLRRVEAAKKHIVFFTKYANRKDKSVVKGMQ
jgi:hypothetical protein